MSLYTITFRAEHAYEVEADGEEDAIAKASAARDAGAHPAFASKYVDAVEGRCFPGDES